MTTTTAGLPPALLAELRQALETCGPFETDASLLAVFVDARIHPWAGGVPSAASRAARIDALIAYLQDQYTPRQENALALFVAVLRDRASARTACRQRLAHLTTALYQASGATAATEGTAGAPAAGAPSATAQSIAAGRDVYHAGRDVIVTQGEGQVQTGHTDGIHARTIAADNVVDGVQVQGAVAADVASLVGLAQAIQRGSITADTIKAGNVVSGLQFAGGQAPATPDALRAELAALRQQVQQAIDAGEIEKAGDAEDVASALATAEAELQHPQPDGGRVARNLETASKILTSVAQAAEAAGKVGGHILNLAPIAAALWKLATTIV